MTTANLSLVLALSLTTVDAQEEVALTKIALLPVVVEGDQVDDVAKLADDLFLTAVKSYGGFEVIGHSDISSIIDFEAQKQILGCEDAACFAEIGGALGVDRLMSVRVSRIKGEWVTTSKLINSKTVLVEARGSHFLRGDSRAYMDTVPLVVSDLFAQTPFAREDTSPLWIAGWTVTGLGAAGLAVGTYFGIQARSDYGRATSTTETGGQKFVEPGEDNQKLENIFLISSAAVLAVGAGLLAWDLWPKSEGEADT
jgi:hypothetical protein